MYSFYKFPPESSKELQCRVGRRQKLFHLSPSPLPTRFLIFVRASKIFVVGVLGEGPGAMPRMGSVQKAAHRRQTLRSRAQSISARISSPEPYGFSN